MKRWMLLGVASSLIFFTGMSRNHNEKVFTRSNAAENLAFARQQLHYDLSHLYSDSPGYPRTVKDNGMIRWVGAGDWTSGFFPGELWYLFDYTGKPYWKVQAEQWTKGLKDQQYNEDTHDVGFMMYCSYGNGYRLTKSKEYKQVLIRSARSLASRFDPDVGAIKSWDHTQWEYPVIIDNMMNLELLFWTSAATGDSTYYRIAKQHALTTLKNHFRADGSSYHVINYDPDTGKVLWNGTAQGYADSSTWARGESWGLYGFTMTYRFTKDRRFLDQAQKIAHFILTNDHLPSDYIPYWDYDAPDIPQAPRDVSAAAIMSSAFIDLSRYVDKKDSTKYIHAAGKILKSLSAPPYRAEKVGGNHGFILRQNVGSKPANSEVSVPLVYADYYFVEANSRYLDMLKDRTSSY